MNYWNTDRGIRSFEKAVSALWAVANGLNRLAERPQPEPQVAELLEAAPAITARQLYIAATIAGCEVEGHGEAGHVAARAVEIADALERIGE